MRRRIRCAALLVSLALLSAAAASACTTFVIRDGERAVFGRNLDWIAGAGLVIVNQRGLAKEALPQTRGEPPRWVSKYGSVTFNQVGKELPYGGINEVGLVVEQMMLAESEYPEPDGRPQIGVCQWIQYQLDLHSTVAEVIASDSLVRISPAATPLHFLILDAAGDAAVVEFLGGEMVSRAGDDLPVEVLANSTYYESMRCLKAGGGAGGNLSLQHFVDAAAMIGDYDRGGSAEGLEVIDYAFRILEKVDQGSFTRWSIVYDGANMRVYFRTYASPAIKYIDVAGLNFECGSRALALDIDTSEAGKVNERMAGYTAEMNREVILNAFEDFRKHDFLDESESDLIDLSEYPDSFECVEK